MDIIENLQSTRNKTLEYFELDDNALSKSYGPGKWTVKEILHHLVDAETVLYDRIRRGISNPNQVVWGFDQDKWAQELDYAGKAMETDKEIYKAVRQGIIYLASSYYDSYGHHELVHSRTGKKTLKDIFDKVVWHNQQHLDQIEVALST